MTALRATLRQMIEADGPMSVERFMALALGHPRHGYYMTRDPLGAAGDFTTAPEISQMFGELLGLWSAAVWQRLGGPALLRLVELGPGRGTLVADAVRAARALPGFRAALDIHFVETSPVLRAVQENRMASEGIAATWHDRFDASPPGPAVILANEFFDALPIRQFVRTARGVFERLVGLDDKGDLVFGLSPEPVAGLEAGASLSPEEQTPFEVGSAARQYVEEVSDRLCRDGGALLVIDYGSMRSGPGDTLQALRRHRSEPPLLSPGEADLTAHVDFAALKTTAMARGATVHGPVEQGAFLHALGLDVRAAALTRSATDEQAAAIAAAVARLRGPDPGMGQLFKVMAVSSPSLQALPGFDEDRSS